MRRVKLRNLCVFLGALLSLLIVAVGGITITSCDKISNSLPSDTRNADSVYVATNLEAIVNPSLNSIQEVLIFQNKLIEEYSIDETFRSLPEEIVKNVTTVCLKKNNSVTKQDIVFEYRANREVYDNLVTTTAPIVTTEQTQSTAMEVQQTPASTSVSYHYEVDTIEGKPIKVLVKLVKDEKYESELSLSLPLERKRHF